MAVLLPQAPRCLSYSLEEFALQIILNYYLLFLLENEKVQEHPHMHLISWTCIYKELMFRGTH